jgi:Protein of unknown function (DUF3866)
MPLSLRRGTVTAIGEEHDELVRLEVDGAPCVAYPRLTGAVAVGDDVLVNEQARRLELGSGGFDVLYANLTQGIGLAAADRAHVMTLPYTPLQAAVRHGEEDVELARDLDSMPVVCCTVHSQVASVCAALAGFRVVYVQVAGGALPVSLSDAVRTLRARGLVELAIAAAPCIDGDVQCVNIHSALAYARARGADVVVCSPGPGLVGTGTSLGHGAVAAAEAGNAAGTLGGVPVLAVRVSERDERERHRGASHHARTVLALALGGITVAWPSGVDAPAWLQPRTEVDASGWRDACADLPLSFMGRGRDEEPQFFAAAYAAGLVARSLAR